ncbi:SRPBCC family protein [Nocardia puris]|uniref:Polyketide cyclase/dehydrase/lipid transport protein n=1 Tax=Nocardia puris TaxID=208602 RepID=A0A366DH96_9NOCA|nr:SRPBCC family protein [Nocardia puris]RBO89443.1 polyketide cyclase/dehydrase/lipid transport protein [Nocardia puris]
MVRLVILALVAAAFVAALVALVTALVLRRRAQRVVRNEIAPFPDRTVAELAELRPTFTMTTDVHLDSPPERIWTALEEGAFSWIPFIPGIHYRGADRTPGAVRTLDAVFFAADEQVLRREEHRRLTVVGIRTSVPLFVQSYVADFRLTATSDGGTDLSWTVGGRPALFAFLPLSWTAPFIRPFAKVVLRRLTTAL